jgi:uncharacterized protein (TIGR03067 family)
MRRRLTLSMLVVLVALALAAVAFQAQPYQPGQDKLQGAWWLNRETREGSAMIPGGGPHLTVRGHFFTSSDYSFNTGIYAIDATKAPRWIDFKYLPGGPTRRGIYRLEGEVLTICAARPGDPRPADFTIPPGSNRALRTYGRKALPIQDLMNGKGKK